jgi:tetratricopeptide (TPR) repeat protein
MAIESYGTVIEMEPNYSVAYNNRCYVLAKMGRTEDAMSDCDKALEMQPRNPAYLDSRAYAHLRAGNYEKAVEDYDAAIREFPQFSYGLYGRGVAKIRLGDESGGRADIASAEEIDPEIVQLMEEIDIRL